MALSLGQLLKETAEQEKSRSVDLAKQQADEEMLAKMYQVEAFFKSTCKAFEDGIVARKPIKSLKMKLCSRGKWSDVYSSLEMFRLTGGQDISTHIKTRVPAFAPLYEEFVRWQLDNQLTVSWEYQWDGGGIESWYVLSVKPQL